jgi:hypothetical protein
MIEEFRLLGCTLVKVKLHFGGTYRLHLLNQKVGLLHAGFLLGMALKMEVICSSETLVDFHHTTWHYNPEHVTLHSHGCHDLKSNKSNRLWQSLHYAIQIFYITKLNLLNTANQKLIKLVVQCKGTESTVTEWLLSFMKTDRLVGMLFVERQTQIQTYTHTYKHANPIIFP